MTSYVSSSNPYTLGFKPRAFLNARKNMLTQEKMSREVNKNYYPKKDIEEFTNESTNPNKKEFMAMVPWMVTAAVIFFALI